MQDIHSIGGGRLYGGGDRRLRPHNHQNHQALKCPRCDSLNTKFCYYNNYNLSQPRHFCKSCRRYWTKGGVLRNVPVGGGCRKTKRSSKPKAVTDSAASETQTTTSTSAPPQQPQPLESKTNSHSSSESSSLTVTNTNGETVSVHSSSSVSNVLNLKDNDNTNKFLSQATVDKNKESSFEPSTTALLEQGSDCGIFSEIGSFTSLITSSSTNQSLSFGFNNLLNGGHQVQQEPWQQQQQAPSSTDMTSGFLDQTVHVELSTLPDRSGNGGFGSLDWQGSGGGDHPELFHLPNAVDHATYWSQNTQWSDQDQPSLYLP